MNSRNRFFISLTTVIGGMFLFCCISIIYYVLKMNEIPEDQLAGNTLSFVYLFIHLIALAVLIYFSLKSYFQKDQLLSIFMTTDNGRKNPTSYRNALIVASVSGVVGIFFFLNAFGIIGVTSFLSLGLNLALTNVALSLFALALSIFFYKPPIKEVDVKNIE